MNLQESFPVKKCVFCLFDLVFLPKRCVYVVSSAALDNNGGFRMRVDLEAMIEPMQKFF